MRQSWETMTSVPARHIILTPTQLDGSGRPSQGSSPRPPHQVSRALPTELCPSSPPGNNVNQFPRTDLSNHLTGMLFVLYRQQMSIELKKSCKSIYLPSTSIERRKSFHVRMRITTAALHYRHLEVKCKV